MVALVLLYEVGEARKRAKRRSKIDIFTLGTTDHGETCTNGQKKFFSQNRPYYSTLDSPWRDESNGTTFKWIREKKFFRPFVHVSPWSVVPKSENVDFTAKIVSDALSFVLESSFFSKSVNLRSYLLARAGGQRDFWNLTNLLEKDKKERKEREKSLSFPLSQQHI